MLCICSVRGVSVTDSEVAVPPPGDSCSLYMMMEMSSDGRRTLKACLSVTSLHQTCL